MIVRVPVIVSPVLATTPKFVLALADVVAPVPPFAIATTPVTFSAVPFNQIFEVSAAAIHLPSF